MALETLMLVLIAAAAVAVVGFAIGRFSSPGERNRQTLQTELDHTRDELSSVRDKVDSHFSESTRLFGTLAHDYHALFDHFAQTSRDLGLTERETSELLSPAMRRLPAGESNAVSGDDASREERLPETETGAYPQSNIPPPPPEHHDADSASREHPQPEETPAREPRTAAASSEPSEEKAAANDDARDEHEPERDNGEAENERQPTRSSSR